MCPLMRLFICVFVCLCVCLSVTLRISKTVRVKKFLKIRTPTKSTIAVMPIESQRKWTTRMASTEFPAIITVSKKNPCMHGHQIYYTWRGILIAAFDILFIVAIVCAKLLLNDVFFSKIKYCYIFYRAADQTGLSSVYKNTFNIDLLHSIHVLEGKIEYTAVKIQKQV